MRSGLEEKKETKTKAIQRFGMISKLIRLFVVVDNVTHTALVINRKSKEGKFLFSFCKAVSSRNDANANKQGLNLVSSNGYDWENLDDQATTMKCHAWETLANALSGEEPSLSSVLAMISKELSTDFILHEAIELGVPDHALLLLDADRFPILLTQVDGKGVDETLET